MRKFILMIAALLVAAPLFAADWTEYPTGGRTVDAVTRSSPQAFVIIVANATAESIEVPPGVKVLIRCRRAIANPQGAPAVSVEAYDCPTDATAYNDATCSQVQSASISSLTGVHPAEYLWNISIGGRIFVRTSTHPAGSPPQQTLIEVRYEGGEGEI
jgi:hypothetical protein